MKSLNLLIAFVLGLIYLPVLYALDPTGGTISLFTFLVLIGIVITICFFAIMSLHKGESKLGAVVIILTDILLLWLTLPLYLGFNF